MNKEKPIKGAEQPTSNVRSYFTKEINAQITEMGAKEMESTMKDLINHRHWIALLKYTSMRMPLLDMSLRGTDPIKDPSKISWSQGAMAGLSDIENYIIELNAPPAKTEAEDDREPGSGREGIIMGN